MFHVDFIEIYIDQLKWVSGLNFWFLTSVDHALINKMHVGMSINENEQKSLFISILCEYVNEMP